MTMSKSREKQKVEAENNPVTWREWGHLALSYYASATTLECTNTLGEGLFK